MNSAILKIIFCTYNKNPYFSEFNVEGQKISTSKKETEIKIPFDIYEQDLGKKVCEYTLSSDGGDFKFSGLFEIFSGYNIAYCFIDNVGTTFEILFLQKIEKLECFKNYHYVSSVLDARHSKVEIALSLNQNNTKDRANLILINCLPNTTIKKNGESFIDLEKIKTNIDNFSVYNSYQLCFHFDNFGDCAYRQIKQIEKLNMASLYEQFNEEVKNIFDKILDGMEKDEEKSINNAILLYKKNQKELEHIIKRKYTFGKKILEEELNQEYYIDFIYKIIFLILVDENIIYNDSISISDLIDIHSKFLENKNKICGDNLLKISEKILLIIEIYFSSILEKDDYKLHYYHSNNFEKDSPLSNAYIFLNKFIDELDYDSVFYYPLLLIDGDKYDYKYVRNNYIKFITTFGFNMLSLGEIKVHLKNMVHNIILLSDYLNEDDSAITNSITGLVYLNKSHFKTDKILKKISNKNNSKYNFIISKTLLHEFFGHEKSAYSRNDINYNSIISFKNEFGELKLLTGKKDDLFKDSNQIISSESIDGFEGESGFFLEYFLGKIGKEFTLTLIDAIENSVDLRKLLDPKLWHSNLKTLQEYIKLMVIIKNSIPEIKIVELDEKLGIEEQITALKSKIIEQKKKNENEKDKSKNFNEAEIDKKINEIFEDIVEKFKKRKKVKIGKRRGITRYNQNGNDSDSNLKISSIKGFAQAFYKK